MMQRSESVVVTLAGRVQAPLLQLYALYVLLHGHYSPGGGFQAGANLAGSFLIFRITEGYPGGLKGLSTRGATYLALIGIITSIISVYYYLRPVVAMYFHEASEPAQKTEPAWGLHLTLTVTSLGILILGLFPNRIVELSIESVKNIGS